MPALSTRMRVVDRSPWIVIVLVAAAGCSSGQGTRPNAGTAGHGGGAGAGGSASLGGAGGTAGATGGTTSMGRGGATPTGGSGGATGGATSGGSGGGSGGMAAGGGATGGTTQLCSFQIDGAPSPAIPTVGIVDWSTDLGGLTSARIEFTLNDPAADEINRGSGGPIDVAGTQHRALMLGLKPARGYTYRIVATAGGKVCTSPDRTLTTGADPDAAKIVLTSTRNASAASAPAQGFIVTSDYGAMAAYIFDADGDVVWFADAPAASSRARMDWEGQNMWMLAVNGNQGGVGKVRRTSLDGTDVLDDVAGLQDAHHDLTVLPGGIVATVLWSGESTSASTLVERSPDGTIKTVGRIAENVFGTRTSYHANSVAYHVLDDTYTVGDLDSASFVKLTRAGTLLWRFTSNSLFGNHGHQLLDGGILVFKARMMPSPVYEYSLTEGPGTVSSFLIWSYTPTNGLGTTVLGDVQRLPNGNTLITYSEAGEMREISAAGELVRSFQVSSSTGARRRFGYADFREILYGPPLR